MACTCPVEGTGVETGVALATGEGAGGIGRGPVLLLSGVAGVVKKRLIIALFALEGVEGTDGAGTAGDKNI